ncbi:hypothetical protein HO133_000411 [Letharia lupina]|uniref:S-adenosyl-L-methionine-dependent methyltransferase n=1 Tax=Letharia lupina TaxID=560253 RepID=A0A8H6CHL3_9LECA|nr:uncharacterized protein HO133_000411 [Letharia lupina]KAF6223568.1 hypothetical protein HO133_000411 [Letharia lupina]
MATTTESIAVEPYLQASNYGDDPDSAYGDEVGSYTTSLASNITDYKIENNRRYHAYKEGSYLYPNDEKESDRLDIMHKLTEVSLGGKLNLAPVPSNLQRILDIGTGTGIWAMEMGDKYPNAEILGNDLSAIQPRWVPPNVRFEIDDVEANWTYHQTFDYIHCRFMGSAIRNWPRLVRQCFEHTKPGGWVECIDLDLEWNSPDGSLTPDLASKHFNTTFLAASREGGMEPCPGPLLEGWLRDAGFKDVAAERHVWPVGTWPADRYLKEVGAWNYLQIMEGLEAFTYALFTRVLGYSQQEVDVVCAKIRKEMKNPKMHAYFYLHVAYGKKPEDK